jgi:hypothetical protein
MAQVGLSTAAANALLTNFTAATAVTASHVAPHTNVGDPGAAGTSNPFTGFTGQPTRPAITWAAAASGARSITTTLPEWAITSSATIAHISVWSASTAGTFQFSATLTTAKAVTNGDTLRLTSLTVTLTPIAA